MYVIQISIIKQLNNAWFRFDYEFKFDYVQWPHALYVFYNYLGKIRFVDKRNS